MVWLTSDNRAKLNDKAVFICILTHRTQRCSHHACFLSTQAAAEARGVACMHADVSALQAELDEARAGVRAQLKEKDRKISELVEEIGNSQAPAVRPPG